MIVAHVDTMNGVNSWTLKAEKIANGATLTVSAPTAETTKLKVLGFIGVMMARPHEVIRSLC
ncbi:MAG: hypothetical protein EBV64_15155, partial [Oxalobacteraceae bacterium]|nr:hypothetical protein [Oxalobacteraceae bacterium]